MAEIGPGVRPGRLEKAELDRRLKKLAPAAGVSAHGEILLRAVLLLWHDYLDECHQIAQGIDNHHGSLAHAMMHRREMDFGNSKYWFRRAGQHAAFSLIPKKAAESRISGRPAGASFVRNGEWDPFAFVDACEKAGKTRTDGDLKAWQKIEVEAVLEIFAGL